jgi:signal peptidase I
MKKTSQISQAIIGLLLFSVTSPVLVNAVPEHLYLTVRGDSMVPALTEGDTVKVKLGVDGSSIDVGDIIVYCTIATMAYNPNPDAMWIGHRVVEKYQRNGKWYFKTKGDNVPEPDPWEVPEHFLLGVVVGVTCMKTKPSSYSHENLSVTIDHMIIGEFFLGLVIGVLLRLAIIRHSRKRMRQIPEIN